MCKHESMLYEWQWLTILLFKANYTNRLLFFPSWFCFLSLDSDFMTSILSTDTTFTSYPLTEITNTEIKKGSKSTIIDLAAFKNPR